MPAAKTDAAADRNLLFGILAVQMDFVSAGELIAAMNAWVLDKQKSLGGHLLAAGGLSPDTHSLIQALVDKHVEQHGGRVEKSLAALSSIEPLRRELSQIVDADVQTSLAHAGARNDRLDRHATLVTPEPRDVPTGERFHILRPYASGGLGKVSVARDAELNREVALKELHDRHADNPDSRARFLQEAEITGGLEHPGVVPIYGLGQYADGRPFYAMRFIRGDSLGEAIERFHKQADPNWDNPADILQLRRLLGRLVDVCNAVEYAHSRGVLHRDLKPGNVMLGQYGETLVVDWGLAKPLGKPGVDSTTASPEMTLPLYSEGALTPQSGSGSAPTQMGSAVGTPAFMSPEQAAGRLDQLGPASDVYSLGATLYMLLTGKPPQDDDDLGVVLQRVQRGEFPAPREANAAVPRGLEAICLKAMALAPSARYPSPLKMADDVEAWLADEPVSALPERWSTRARRWIKKHRTFVTSAAAVLLAALVLTTSNMIRLNAANEREREAKDLAVEAKNVAEKAEAEAKRQTGRNSELLGLARKSLERYEKLSRSEQLSRYGMESLRSDLQESALEYYSTLASQAGESEQDRADRGHALYQLGGTYWQLGRVDQALAAYGQSRDVYQQLEQEHLGIAAYRNGAAMALEEVGEQLVNVYQAAAAAEPLGQARARFEPLHAADPKNKGYAVALAFVWSLEGERLRQLGQMKEAAEAFEQGITILHAVDSLELSADDHHDVRFRLGRGLNQLATLQSQVLWKFDAANDNYRQAKEIMEREFAERPQAGDTGFSLVQILRNWGFLYARQNEIDNARELYVHAVNVLKQIEAKQPDVPHYRQEMAELLHSLSTLKHPLDPRKITAETLAQLEESVAIGKHLVDLFPQQNERREALARYESSLGAAYAELDRGDESQANFTAAADQLNAVSGQAGDNVDTLYTLATMQTGIAEQWGKAGRTADDLAMLDTAEKRLMRLAELAPNFREAHLGLSDVYIERMKCLTNEGRLVEAAAEAERVIVKCQQITGMADAEWMQATSGALVAVAKAGRWQLLSQVRSGGLDVLADRGEYELAARQANLLSPMTGEPSDHYAAAQALAYSALVAANDQKLDAGKRKQTVDSLAADAVKQLEAAWQTGYLRRSSGLAGMFSSAPTLKSIQQAPELAVLRDRDDYAALVRRIQTEEPPKPPAKQKKSSIDAAKSTIAK